MVNALEIQAKVPSALFHHVLFRETGGLGVRGLSVIQLVTMEQELEVGFALYLVLVKDHQLNQLIAMYHLAKCKQPGVRGVPGLPVHQPVANSVRGAETECATLLVNVQVRIQRLHSVQCLHVNN